MKAPWNRVISLGYGATFTVTVGEEPEDKAGSLDTDVFVEASVSGETRGVSTTNIEFTMSDHVALKNLIEALQDAKAEAIRRENL